MKKTLIDANILLELFLDQKKADDCKILLQRIATGKETTIISTFTIDSIIISLERNKTNLSKIREIIKSVINSQGFIIYRPTIKDRLDCLNWIKKYLLDYEDSLTLQCAIVNNCKEIISFDTHFDKVKEIQRIEP